MTRSAFNDIIHKTCRKLYFIAFRILKNQQEAEDVVQEVFVKMWTMKEKLDEYDDKEALAVTITRNKAIDTLRKLKHVDRGLNYAELHTEVLSPSPFEQVVNCETGLILNSIIEGLPENFRNVIIMREIEGLSYEEISNKTSININSLRVTLSRARRIIQEKYNAYSDERGRN